MPSDEPLGDAAWLDDLDELGLDELIEQITVDAHGDEGYWSFRQAFEDHVQLPVIAAVVGAEVSVTGIDFDGDERRGLTATVGRGDRTWGVSLLDVEIPDGHHHLTQLLRAYRRWLGADESPARGAGPGPGAVRARHRHLPPGRQPSALTGYHGDVSIAPEALLEQALSLSPAERAKLASGILASLDDDHADEDEVERQWSDETERRMALLHAGEARPVSWEHVTQRIDGLRASSAAE